MSHWNSVGNQKSIQPHPSISGIATPKNNFPTPECSYSPTELVRGHHQDNCSTSNQKSNIVQDGRPIQKLEFVLEHNVWSNNNSGEFLILNLLPLLIGCWNFTTFFYPDHFVKGYEHNDMYYTNFTCEGINIVMELFRTLTVMCMKSFCSLKEGVTSI